MPCGLCGVALKTRNCGANSGKRRNSGSDTLDYLIRNPRRNTTTDFRKDYFGWHMHYHLASDEKRAIAKFAELLQKHGLGPVFEPKFVS